MVVACWRCYYYAKLISGGKVSGVAGAIGDFCVWPFADNFLNTFFKFNNTRIVLVGYHWVAIFEQAFYGSRMRATYVGNLLPHCFLVLPADRAHVKCYGCTFG